MKFRQDVPQESKLSEQRRGARMNSRAQVVLEWASAEGQQARAEGFTRVVSPLGCLVVAARDLPLEQALQVTNLSNNRSSPAIVVWKGRETPEGFELGLELTSQEQDFWGLEL